MAKTPAPKTNPLKPAVIGHIKYATWVLRHALETRNDATFTSAHIEEVASNLREIKFLLDALEQWNSDAESDPLKRVVNDFDALVQNGLEENSGNHDDLLRLSELLLKTAKRKP